MDFFQKSKNVVYELDRNVYIEIKHMFETNVAIQQTSQVLENFLLNNTSLPGENEVFKEFRETYILPFFKSMLKQVLILGYCPWKLCKIKSKTNETIIVPKIVPVEFIVIKAEIDNKTMHATLAAYDSTTNKIRTDVNIFNFEDIISIANSECIFSKGKHLLEMYRYLKQLEHFTIQSEFVRSNPTIYLTPENQKTDRMPVSSLGRDPMSIERRTQMAQHSSNVDSSRAFEKAGEDIINNMQFHNQELDLIMSEKNMNYYNLGQFFRPQWYNNIFICPPNLRLAHAPQLPNSNIDHIKEIEYFNKQVYMIMGVPEKLFGANSSSSTSSSRSANFNTHSIIMDINTFEATLLRYQKFFTRCFVELYAAIFRTEFKGQPMVLDPPPLFKKFVTDVLVETTVTKNESVGKKRKKNEEKEEEEEEAEETKATKKQTKKKEHGKEEESTVVAKKKKKK